MALHAAEDGLLLLQVHRSTRTRLRLERRFALYILFWWCLKLSTASSTAAVPDMRLLCNAQIGKDKEQAENLAKKQEHKGVEEHEKDKAGDKVSEAWDNLKGESSGVCQTRGE